MKDHEAFTALFDHLSPSVLGFLIRILGTRSLGEEVLQEVFLQVWQQANLYHPNLGSARGWLFTIARSRGLDRLRQERAAGRREQLLAEDRARHVAFPLQMARAEARERHRGLTDALGRLPTEQRICMELVLFEGLTQSQVARRLAAPLGTVKSRIRLGMIKVRELIKTRKHSASSAVHPKAASIRGPS